MDELTRDALTHVLIAMEAIEKTTYFSPELYSDLTRLHMWLEKNYPLD